MSGEIDPAVVLLAFVPLHCVIDDFELNPGASQDLWRVAASVVTVTSHHPGNP